MKPEKVTAEATGDAIEVTNRLNLLRGLYVPEGDAEARVRLARERPAMKLSFESAVAARLRELRGLCALADHLHRATAKH